MSTIVKFSLDMYQVEVVVNSKVESNIYHVISNMSYDELYMMLI